MFSAVHHSSILFAVVSWSSTNFFFVHRHACHFITWVKFIRILPRASIQPEEYSLSYFQTSLRIISGIHSTIWWNYRSIDLILAFLHYIKLAESRNIFEPLQDHETFFFFSWRGIRARSWSWCVKPYRDMCRQQTPLVVDESQILSPLKLSA